MTDYAVGDIQGCYNSLRKLLDKLAFDPAQDRLWVAGDIVNRGPDSLESLRFIRSLGDAAVTVLGNHDLHLLAVLLGGHSTKRKDTLDDILSAPDRDELTDWLRRQHFAWHDPERNILMCHAGIPHVWTVEQAVALGREMEQVIQGEQAGAYFRQMYGNQPARWSDDLEGMDRWRVITNYLTRMRFIAADGSLDLATKDSAHDAPEGFAPWFTYPRTDTTEIVFGHWAALEGRTGTAGYHGLDTGCCYGAQLTAMNLDTMERISCDCSE